MNLIEEEYITCSRCAYRFERENIAKFCSNCWVCTGCEIYYCPRCDLEIVVTPRQLPGDTEKMEGL